jgi:RNA polymerase sigma-70 factor (ECF subfamily)
MTTRPQEAAPAVVPEANPKEPSDRSLLRGIQSGSQDSAVLLYRRYAQRLHALVKARFSRDLARRIEPDDLVQSVFCTFFRKAGQGCYDVPAGAELWGLLLVIALNKVRARAAFFQASRRDVRVTSRLDGFEPPARPSVAEDVAYTHLRLVVEETLQPLPPSHRDVVRLRIEGHEVAEIADKTQRSKRTVERVLQGFREKLDASLREDR